MDATLVSELFDEGHPHLLAATPIEAYTEPALDMAFDSLNVAVTQ
jgi:hypothetical protein